MKKLEVKAYAKINLSLDVVRRRPDGYHDVKMIMQTVGLYDVIMLEKAEHGITAAVEMGESFADGTEELPADENNLIFKAAKLITEHCGISEGVHKIGRAHV